MSMQVQMGPPGSLGAGQFGVGHSSPVPENIHNSPTAQRQAAQIDDRRINGKHSPCQ